jgi:hypothetical protein
LHSYQQALESATKAQARFESLNVPYNRPEDYFAEMVKNDHHMAKVRPVACQAHALVVHSTDCVLLLAGSSSFA